MLKKIEILFLSFFKIGFLPKAPGTWASLATVPLLYVLNNLQIHPLLMLPTFIMLTAAACLITEWYQKREKIHDPGWIVIDEVLGMLTAYFFIGHLFKTSTIIYLFCLFRFFDIYKFYPANFFDKMEHGAGTILDDIVSGIYTGLVLLLLHAAMPQVFF